MTNVSEDWDYIIIGAGSAGCILANRLSADPSVRVLLLEAGGADNGLSLRIPAGLVSAIFNDKYNWKYPTVPDASRNDIDYTWSGGKALGGSSSINGMLYIRGAAADYDQWAEIGCKGWDYASVLPYFRSLECFEHGEDEYRGGDGPLAVTFPVLQPPLVQSVIDAAKTCGHAYNPDYNGAEPGGVGIAQATIKNGRRHSASKAFLTPIKSRGNLKILTGVHATKILLDGKKACGVAFMRHGKDNSAACRGEVIVSAGAIGSPKLLMLSGIGDSAALTDLGIEVAHASSDVGSNLMEHPGVYVSANTSVPSFNRAARPQNMPFVFLNWLLFGGGPAAVGTTLAQVICRSSAHTRSPDLQLLLTLATFAMKEDGSGIEVAKEDAIAMACCLLQPKGRGRVFLTSSAPMEPPTVDHRLLGEEEDVERLTEAAKKAIEIFAAKPLEGIVSKITCPVALDAPRDEWHDYLRLAAFRGDHPSGTCRMGSDDRAVVDERLRVNGIESLRVVDASIIPIIPSGNTNAPVMMIAEKAAHMIAQDRAGQSA